MEQRDLELERRVWQRVNGANGGKTAQPCTQEVPETSLRELEQRSREAANVFGQLAQTVSGMMRQMLQELGREATADEIGEKMGMSAEKVREIMKIAQEPVSLETPIGEEDD